MSVSVIASSLINDLVLKPAAVLRSFTFLIPASFLAPLKYVI